MAQLIVLSLDDPVDESLSAINANFAAINDELANTAPAAHAHSAADITSGVLAAARLGSGTPSAAVFLRGDQTWSPVEWDLVAFKPSTFPPSVHGHDASDITSGVIDPLRLGSGTPGSAVFLRGDGVWAGVTWDLVIGKPSSFPPSAHTHALSDLQQGGASAGQVLAWNGSAWAPTTLQTGGGPTPFQSVWSSFTATPNSRYRIADNNLTVTLPASPADGDWIELVGSGITGTVVNRNGKSIMGLAENMTIDVPNFAIRLVYISSAGDWMIAP